MVEITSEVDVVCRVCNRTLDASLSRGMLRIEPCPTCTEKAEDEARQEGYDSGYADAETNIREI